MYRLGIIAESLKDISVLDTIKDCLFAEREEYVPNDSYPHWHIKEYRLEDGRIEEIAQILKENIKETWYIHAFDETSMIVILKGRYFILPLKRDKSWKEMIKYGVKVAKVKKNYLKSVPLHI